MKKVYPFKFLDAYNEDDTGIFFGRDEEISALYDMVFQSDILLVYGASGTGKTSLIQCGLASRFQSHDWLAINIRRGNNLNESLDKALKETGGEDAVISGVGEDWKNVVMEKIENAERIKDFSPEEAQRLWISVRQEELFLIKQLSPLELLFKTIYLRYFKPIYLIFDQFEELFIIGTKEEQDEFISSVQEILKIDQPIKMIFSIREEYLGYLDSFEKAIPQLLRKKLRVEPMNFDKVSQVIWGATHFENTNVKLKAGEEEKIIEGIFDKLKGGQKSLTIELPYLQVFLDKLYMYQTKDDERKAEAELTLDELNKLGDIGDVLREFLEEQVKCVNQNLIIKYPDATEENIWKILSPFVTLEGTKEPMSKKNLKDRLSAIDNGLIDKIIESFVNRRILRKSEKEDMYEIAHDSLAWRIAEKRTAEENSLLEIVRIIKNQTFLKGEAREFFSERKLNIIEPFLEKLREQKLIDEEGEELIRQSRKAIEQQKEAKLTAKQKELELANQRAKDEEELRMYAVRSEIKAKKRSRTAAITATIAFVIAGAALFFFIQAQIAKRTAQESEAEMKKQTEKSEKLIKSFYFWDDRLALASEINKFTNEKNYGIIDKDGKAVVRFRYSAAEQFEYPGIAKVRRDSINYLVDTKGREYKVANSLSGLRGGKTALDLRGTSGGFSSEIFSRTKLRVLILDGAAQINDFGFMPEEIAKLKNLRVLSLDNCNLDRLPKEIDQLSSLHSLGLAFNSLKSLPPEIGQLESLQDLYLKHNELNQLPPEIGKLSSLQSLDLSYNRLNELCPEIGQLKSLRKLVLDSNQLKSLPDEISQLKSLQILRLFENQLTQLPPEIGQLDSLQNLDMSRNQLKELPEEIGQLGSLRNLDLSHNGNLIELPEEIGKLRSLQILNLSGNNLTQLPSDIWDLYSMQELAWDNNNLESLPSEIGDLRYLQFLNLSGNKLTELPDEIRKLSSLQILYLFKNMLSQLPPEIGELNSLQNLDLSLNQLNQLPIEIGQLNSLQGLMLSFNQLTQLPAEIGQLNSLQKFALNDNQLISLPPEFGQLHSLQILSLDNNKIAILPPEIGDLSSLKILSLDSNMLMNVPPEIGGMISLQSMSLAKNQLTEFPTGIEQLSSLITLDLSDNQLNTSPAEIGQFKSLRRLDLIGNKFSGAEQKRTRKLLPNCLVIFSINDDIDKLLNELPDFARQQLEDYEEFKKQQLEDFQHLKPENYLEHQPETNQEEQEEQRKDHEGTYRQEQSEYEIRQPEQPIEKQVLPELEKQEQPPSIEQQPVFEQQQRTEKKQPQVIISEPKKLKQKIKPPGSQFIDYGVKGGIKYVQIIPLSEYTASYSFSGRGYVGVELSHTICFELGVGYGQYVTKYSSESNEVEDYTTTSEEVKTNFLPVDARIKYTPWVVKAKSWNPYFYAGAGLMYYSVKNAPESADNSQYRSGKSGYAAILPAGIGTELMLSNRLLLDFNVGTVYTTTDYLNNLEVPNFLDASANIGLGFTIGNFKTK